jgi:hypothetical protein
LIAEPTYRMLGTVGGQFEFGRNASAKFPGKSREVMVYEVVGRKTELVKRDELEEQVRAYTASLPRVTQILAGKSPSSNEGGGATEDETRFLEERLPPSPSIEEL